LSTHAQTPLQRPTSSFLASLPGSPALKNLAIKQIEAHNGCYSRGGSLKATGASWTSEAATDPAKVKEMPGVTAPLGFFDPWGLSARVNEGQLLYFREAELKHGRICMIAILGLIVGDTHTFIPQVGAGTDWAGKPASVLLSPFVAETRVEMLWPTIVASIGMYDLLWSQSAGRNSRAPGQYNWDPLGIKPRDEVEYKKRQTQELNNGRLAMIATAGILAQEAVDGKPVFR